MALSFDLRRRVLEAIDDGMDVSAAAATFNVGRRTIYDWFKLREETGDFKRKSGYQKGHSHKIKDLKMFKVFVEKNKYLTQEEMARKWGEENNIMISDSAIFRALKKIGYTSKKNIFLSRSKARKA
jgi:transposase